MILSVVVSKLQKSQWERIEEEFKFVDYELIINKDPIKAIKDVNGRFVLFLEEDSAFYPGELRNSLDIFRFNKSYRKLAMVASSVDYDSIIEEVGFCYDNKFLPAHGDVQYPTSIGYIYGSIIRTSALKKAIIPTAKDALCQSAQLSDFFWSHGLRIELNPKSIYYAPSNYTPDINCYKIKNTSEAVKVWKKEFIV
jgi:hypothetical protein